VRRSEEQRLETFKKKLLKTKSRELFLAALIDCVGRMYHATATAHHIHTPCHTYILHHVAHICCISLHTYTHYMTRMYTLYHIIISMHYIKPWSKKEPILVPGALYVQRDVALTMLCIHHITHIYPRTYAYLESFTCGI